MVAELGDGARDVGRVYDQDMVGGDQCETIAEGREDAVGAEACGGAKEKELMNAKSIIFFVVVARLLGAAGNPVHWLKLIFFVCLAWCECLGESGGLRLLFLFPVEKKIFTGMLSFSVFLNMNLTNLLVRENKESTTTKKTERKKGKILFLGIEHKKLFMQFPW